jgi:hypothetical protein
MKLVSFIQGLLATSVLVVAPALHAQAPGVPVENLQPLLQDSAIIEKAGKLREAGKLLDAEAIAKQLVTPMPGAVKLPEVATKPLRGREIAERARQGYLRLGWYYLCPRCDHWHVSLAGAYAIAPDAIATCHHCVTVKDDMRKGYLIAVDSTGEVLPVTAILAKSQTMDCAILRVEGGNFKALPLNDNVAPGDPAYCLSEPLGQHGYFSTGIVNRFYWQRPATGAPGSVDAVKSLRVNVSTDWAPGSSGAAVLDECGNVIGHVSTISPMAEGGRPATVQQPEPKAAVDPKKETPKVAPKTPDQPLPAPRVMRDRFGGAVLITLHEAVPARGVRALAGTLDKAPEAKTPEAKPTEPKSTETKPSTPAKPKAEEKTTIPL